MCYADIRIPLFNVQMFLQVIMDYNLVVFRNGYFLYLVAESDH